MKRYRCIHVNDAVDLERELNALFLEGYVPQWVAPINEASIVILENVQVSDRDMIGATVGKPTLYVKQYYDGRWFAQDSPRTAKRDDKFKYLCADGTLQTSNPRYFNIREEAVAFAIQNGYTVAEQ